MNFNYLLIINELQLITSYELQSELQMNFKVLHEKLSFDKILSESWNTNFSNEL